MIIDFEKSMENEKSKPLEEINEAFDNEVPDKETKLSKDQSVVSDYIIKALNMHKHPIKFIKMNWRLGICLSIDERSSLELWSPQNYDFPTNLKYSCKI